MWGTFITFEGIEGSGKSTQAQLLTDYLRKRGYEVEFSREPGGTEIGERIREILLDPGLKGMEPRTELFLYLASRNQVVREKVLPALQKGKIVVLDRFADSSIAYQGYARGLGEKLVARWNKIVTGGLRPHLTIFVDVPVAVGQKRKKNGALDRLEQEGVNFHERVREGYLRLARRAPKRIKIVTGSRPVEEIFTEICGLVEGLLEKRCLKKPGRSK
ncbi:MAG: dTMP kinase [candidate division WOR-3 bacterium]